MSGFVHSSRMGESPGCVAGLQDFHMRRMKNRQCTHYCVVACERRSGGPSVNEQIRECQALAFDRAADCSIITRVFGNCRDRHICEELSLQIRASGFDAIVLHSREAVERNAAVQKLLTLAKASGTEVLIAEDGN